MYLQSQRGQPKHGQSSLTTVVTVDSGQATNHACSTIFYNW